MLAKILKQSTGKLAWLRLQRVVEGGSGLSHSYGSFSHDDVGVPKQWKASILVYQKQMGIGARNDSVCSLIIARLGYI